ncbi:AraC family transcriptional regulator [Halioxenophilus sp. WMMB6]|uniref:AraC family transcriptional regulator n=1 Tax=Halioxenophilus sp. WMMB6 TaxID=3073815 RepID=UPI00295E42DA|nr:AraC family transcriptional regulator [Halioxenophilus sp. WMMB6]
MSYQEKISRVCDFIQQNLDESLPLDRLSLVAGFSKYHFARLFAANTGITVNRFIQLCRLRRASFQLAFEPEQKIIEVALVAGFDSPEAFARAFRRVFDQSPSEFRAAPNWPHWHAQFEFSLPRSEGQTMTVTIVDFPETKIAYLTHRGAPESVLNTVSQFIDWRKTTGLSPVKTSATYGIPNGDPNTMPAEDFRWDVCGTIEADVPDNAFGVTTGFIPGGRCVRVRHLGSLDNLDQTVYPIYREWLPAQGEEPGDFPCFFHYLNFVHEVAEAELMTDVYIPLK